MSDDASEQITLDELIRLGIDARLVEVHTALPAVVREYDRAAGTVGVSIPISKMVPDGSGNFVAEGYPTLKDIRIEWPGCGKFLITWPLEAGDEGVLVICQHNLGPWRTAGDAVEAGDVAMHTLDGAVFRPAPLTDGKPPTTADVSNMVIGSTTDGKGRIEILPAGGRLGAGASKEIARKGDSVNLGDCHVVVGSGAVTAVFINGVALPVGADPGTATRGTISSGSATWKAVD